MKRKCFFVILFLTLAIFLSGCNGGGTTPPITTNQSPIASFTANPTSGEVPLEVSFNASNSTDTDGTIVSYAWDFKDGTTGNGETVNHTFSSIGNYNVKLTVTDNKGATTSATKTITVTEPITPAEVYQYWKGDIPNSYYWLNIYGIPATKITGKPFLVLTYDRISQEITDCEFGLSEVTEEIIADGGIPVPCLDAEMIDFHEKLGLKSPVDLVVCWICWTSPAGDNKSPIINSVQQFSFLHPANGIGPGKNCEKWIFNYTSDNFDIDIEGALKMTGGVTNLDTYYFLGSESEPNAFNFELLKQ